LTNLPPKFSVVAAVIVKDDKVLMCRSRGNEHYYCPGGKLEEGESEIDAIIRECKEEISIDVIPESVEKLFKFEAEAYGFSEPKIVIMNCYKFDYRGEVKASSEIDDLLWAGLSDLEKLAPAAQNLLNKLFSSN
jgi:8-oxo-dGTP diphosphatase